MSNTKPRWKTRAHVIERSIPLPPHPSTAGRGKGPLRLALESMAIGDSILNPRSVRSLSPQICVVAKAEGLRFTTRTVEGGTRIWRLS